VSQERQSWQRSLGLVLLAATAIGGLVLVGWGIGELVVGPLDTSVGGIDRDVIETVSSWRTPWLTEVMRKVTFFGSTVWLVGSLFVLVLVSIFVLHSQRWAAFAVGCMIGGFISTPVKDLVDRPRPALAPLLDLSNAAWPSAHAVSAAISMGAIAWFLVRGMRFPPQLVWPLAGIAIAMVGFTRIYLGVHWPSDIVAGWALGLAWVAIVTAIVRPDAGTKPSAGVAES